MKDNRTTGHYVTLVKDQYILDITKYAFSQRTINDCLTASSVNIFKNKVDTYLRRADYS